MFAAVTHPFLSDFLIVGLLVALPIFFAGMLRKREPLKKAGLLIFVGVAILVLPAFFSEEGASEYLPVFFLVITGLIALVLLVLPARKRNVSNLPFYAVLLLGSISLGIMIMDDHSNGWINVPELRGEIDLGFELYRDDDEID